MFAARRERLMRAMRGGAAVFAAGHEALRNGDVNHPFRQRSTFYYLTGFEEPDAVAVLRPGGEHRYVLFVRPRDPERAVWEGPRAGVEGALAAHGADAAHPIDELDDRLPALLESARTIHFPLGSDEHVERLVREAAARRRAPTGEAASIVDPSPLVARLRVVKSREEIALLQRAVDVTGAGIEAAMRAVRPGMHEYEVQAVLQAEYRRLGSPRDGFPPIVAAGANACVLHNPSNRTRIGPRDLLLMDTGAEAGYYGADVTRTFPAGGRFSAVQRAVYDVVLAAQRAGIEAVAPGARFHDAHDAALRVLVRGLRGLGVLEGRTDRLIKRGDYRPYFMHGTSHWLGLDVHDVGAYRDDEGESVVLRPGMVLTVEPGLYFGVGVKAPRRLRGIGVRIEDDVLVTRGGHRVLSAAIPKEPAELEALVGPGA